MKPLHLFFDSLALIVALAFWATTAFGQEPETPAVPPATPPVVVAPVVTPEPFGIAGPVEFKVGEFIDLDAKGVEPKAPLKWVFEGVADPTKAPKIRFRGGDRRAVELSYVPGLWRLRLSVAIGDDIVEAVHAFTIEGTAPVDPNKPPPPVLTLAMLAGKDAAAVRAVYVLLGEGLENGSIDSIALFEATEEELLKSSKLQNHGATAEIVKRLAVKTLDELKAAVTKIVADLGPAPPNTTTATAAVYIYEKDEGEPTSGVMAGINRLNRETKIRATIFEEDTLDGEGEVPDQYKTALEAARKAGLPAFVVTKGADVLKVIPKPTTSEQIWAIAQ